jgi:hypothetical protein
MKIRKATVLIAFVGALGGFASLSASDLVITGVIDGPLTGGLPKAVELCATSDIADLAVYGLGSANNGGGTDGEEFTFPAGSVSAGTFLYIATEGSGFNDFFGLSPNYTSSAMAINGDDAIELFMSGSVVDIFGEIDVDGTGQPGETSNDTATTPFPIGTYSSCTPVVSTPELLLSELVVTPTGGEFIEIYNPTAAVVDLSDVYVTDATFASGGTYYYNIVTGVNAGGGGFGDFHARFPDGAMIGPSEFQTVALAGSDDFFIEYGIDPTYELFEDGIGADGVADMREALPGSINNQGGLTNGGEVVVLYTWDGASDLVADMDYAVWGDQDEAVDKTGVSIDGPDADTTETAYLADTPITLQDVVAAGAHAFGSSFHRVDFAEGAETQTGGNGVTGSDETSEDLSITWAELAPTPGDGPPSPPVSSWVINEMHADPAGDLPGDANGDGIRDFSDDEFIEIVNTDASDLDISGWTVADGALVRHTFPAGTVVPSGCSIVVFGGGVPTGAFGNSLVQTASSGALGLNNSGDTVTLNDGFSDVVSAGYGSEGSDNQSLTLDPDLGLPPYVKHSEATGSGGALYSPGTLIDGSQFSGCVPLPDPWVINEIHADPDSSLGDANGDGSTSTTNDEFVEIVNTTGVAADISGWILSDGFSARHTFPAGTVVPDQCSVVVFGGGTPTGGFGNSLVQVASSGSLGLNNGGDTITLSDGVNDATQASYGGEGGDNQSLTLDPDLSLPPYVKHSVATNSLGTLYSPGTRIDGTQFSGCPVSAEIFEIQGDGLSSPFDGGLVMTEDNVVTAVAPNGFFMQTPAVRSDFNVDTSDGIFVFTDEAPAVSRGDLVDVTGRVNEFFDFTEIGDATVTVVGSSMVPGYVVFDATVPSPDPTAASCAVEFECYEGMLVEIADGTVTGPNQAFGGGNPDPIAEVYITAAPARTFREPGIEFPGMIGLPVWDGNPEVFELDPDRLGGPNQIIPAGSSFSAVGILGYEFFGYELWPTELTVAAAPLPVAVRPRQPGEFTVGTLNLFRLFDDVDDLPDGERNDAVVPTAEYLRRRAKFTSYILDVLDAPDILAVQEAESLQVLMDLAGDIAAVDPAVVYSAHLVEGNDIGTIDVGFLLRDQIAVDAITQLGKDELFTFDNPPSPLHDRPPLLLEGRNVRQFGSFPIAVMVVHNRSLNNIESERTQRKRFEQAESIAQKVQDLQTADPSVRLVVIGDFNAFEFTDGYVDAVGIVKGDFEPADSNVCGTLLCSDLVDPNLTDLALVVDPDERYSFIFRGNGQVLDHALTSQGLAPEITGAEFGRGNADAAVDLINDDGSIVPENLPLRSSDHDGFVVFIEDDEDADGVPNDLDVCPGTVIPEGVPTEHLGVNRFALVDDDGQFDTTLPPSGGPRGRVTGPGYSFDLGDTAGCSCEQIIVGAELGLGHLRFGCSAGEMLEWVEFVTP